MQETVQVSAKRGNFIRVAERRTTNAIRNMELLGNLTNRARYEYGVGDVEKIVGALEAAVEKVKVRMNGLGKKPQDSFKL